MKVVKQLSRRMDELPVELETLYDKHYRNASNPGYTELQKVLIRISECFEKVFFVLDALDECSKGQRDEIFEIFSGIVSPDNATCGNFKICHQQERTGYSTRIRKLCSGGDRGEEGQQGYQIICYFSIESIHQRWDS